MLKRVVLGLSDRMGVNAAVRRATTARRRLLTLCYHSILPKADIRPSYIYRNTVSVEDFREQLETLSSWFEFTSPEAVLQATEGEALSCPSVLITFDDGHENLLQHAAPVLEQFGVAALFHVATGHIGTGVPLWTEELAWIVSNWQNDRMPMPSKQCEAKQSISIPQHSRDRATLTRRISVAAKQLPNQDRLAYLQNLRASSPAPIPEQEREAFRFLDWNGVRELHRRGFTVGSHTVSHSILSRNSPDTLDREFVESKRQLEAELDTPCPWIAYPNGGPQDVTQQVVDRAAAAGYRLGFTTSGGFDDPQRAPLAVGRSTIPGQLPRGAFRAMASGVQDWLARVRGKGAEAIHPREQEAE